MHKTETLNKLTAGDVAANYKRVSFETGIVTWSRWRDENNNGMFYIAAVEDLESFSADDMMEGKGDALEILKKSPSFVLFSRVKDGFPQRGEKVICVCRVDCDTKAKPNVTRNYPLAIFTYENDADILLAMGDFAKELEKELGKTDDE